MLFPLSVDACRDKALFSDDSINVLEHPYCMTFIDFINITSGSDFMGEKKNKYRSNGVNEASNCLSFRYFHSVSLLAKDLGLASLIPFDRR